MAGVDSEPDVTFEPRPPKPAKSGRVAAPLPEPVAHRSIWLDGDVLTCACPDCGAPMSVRLWLLLADCWRCQASIELTPEQQRLAQQLLDERKAAAVKTPAVVAPSPVPPAPVRPPQPVERPPQPPVPVAKLVHAAPPPAPPVLPPPLPKVATLARPAAVAHIARSPRAWKRWLAVAALALVVAGVGWGIWQFSHGSGATAPMADQNSLAAKHRELPPPTSPAEAQARQKAEELTALGGAASRGQPELPKVVAALRSPGQPRMFEGRDPRIRNEILDEEGGSVFTEAAVAAGLHWLSGHQADDGHWSLNHFSKAGDCQGQCDGEGEESDVAATALSLLPFLGAGQAPDQGIYQDAVAHGLRWLVRRQRPNGDLRDGGAGRMYAHGLATIALCEALAVGHDESFRGPAQRAIDFIAHAQHPAGGWRYEPGQEGDMSVAGWQMMALECAKMAYLKVPDDVFRRAGHFLDTVALGRHGGLYAYQAGQKETTAMIAEGLLCRQYLGWPKDHPGLQDGIRLMVRRNLPTKSEPNIYYWYYATQVLHNVGGDDWKTWNKAVRDALLALQEKERHRAGSWAPRGGAIGDHDTRVGGRIYMTSLALCTLEVYYRYLPIYRAIEIEQ